MSNTFRHQATSSIDVYFKTSHKEILNVKLPEIRALRNLPKEDRARIHLHLRYQEKPREVIPELIPYGCTERTNRHVRKANHHSHLSTVVDQWRLEKPRRNSRNHQLSHGRKKSLHFLHNLESLKNEPQVHEGLHNLSVTDLNQSDSISFS